jgi:hypothetical protein
MLWHCPSLIAIENNQSWLPKCTLFINKLMGKVQRKKDYFPTEEGLICPLMQENCLSAYIDSVAMLSLLIPELLKQMPSFFLLLMVLACM